MSNTEHATKTDTATATSDPNGVTSPGVQGGEDVKQTPLREH